MADRSDSSNNEDKISEVMPFHLIMRPIPSILDEAKVKSLMESIQNEEEVPPIDVLWVEDKLGNDYYFSFGGCHRYEAYKRLKALEIPVRIIRSTPSDIAIYVGGSLPRQLQF